MRAATGNVTKARNGSGPLTSPAVPPGKNSPASEDDAVAAQNGSSTETAPAPQPEDISPDRQGTETEAAAGPHQPSADEGGAAKAAGAADGELASAKPGDPPPAPEIVDGVPGSDPTVEPATVIMRALGGKGTKPRNGSGQAAAAKISMDPPDSETVIMHVIGRTPTSSKIGSSTATMPLIPAVGGSPSAGSTAGAPGPSSPADSAAALAGPSAKTGTAAPAKGETAGKKAGSPARGRFRRKARSAEGGKNAPKNTPADEDGRGGYFGLAPGVRPDVLTDAETIMLPALEKNREKARTGTGPMAKVGTAERRLGGALTALKGATLTESATQVMPAIEAPQKAAPPTGRARRAQLRAERRAQRRADLPVRYVTNRRAKRMSRLVLLVILLVQACLSLRLRNTAFEDEAQYLYAGHMELEYLLHGTALQGDYTSFFSGSPVLYPVAAAVLDQVGGLALARALSLVEMLAVTTMVYSITRYFFSERVGLYAAGLYAVCESAIFLGNFATYDATCLSLLAFAAWIMVYSSRCRWPVFMLAAPIAALAVAVKYAGLLFVPTIALMPVLAAWPDRRRRVLLHTVGFLVGVAGLLYLALRVGGHAYTQAIESTTTNRAQGVTSDLIILKEFAEWGGVVFVMAVFGTIAYVRRVHTEPNEDMAPYAGKLGRLVLGVVLTGTALLAPAYQAHLHTDVSFLKHVGFGLFFAAPLAGFGLARIIGDYVRWPHFGVGIWCVALVLGMLQSQALYQAWPNSSPFVLTLSGYLKPHARYLVEVPEVPVYYLMGNPDAQPDQFTSTYFITYYNTKGQALTGPAGFAAAVQAGYFQVIAYTGQVTLAVDGTISKILSTSNTYYLAATVALSQGNGPVNYYIWVKGKRPGGLGLEPYEGDDGRFLLPG